MERVGELRKIESRINFVATKQQSDDQTVQQTDRPSMGRNFAFFQSQTQAETRSTTNGEYHFMATTNGRPMAESTRRMAQLAGRLLLFSVVEARWHLRANQFSLESTGS